MLTRQGCHLCEEALGIVGGVCADLGIAWRSVDVDAEPGLRAPWSDHVPVTFVDGVLFARWFVDAESLRQQLDGRATL